MKIDIINEANWVGVEHMALKKSVSMCEVCRMAGVDYNEYLKRGARLDKHKKDAMAQAVNRI